MTSRFAKIFGAPALGAAVLLTLATASTATAADRVKANIPFAFEVGKKAMPAGDYDIVIDRSVGHITIQQDAKKGTEALAAILTYLAPPQHGGSDHAHLVFDKVGGQTILSEVWEPNMDGVLIYLTKGPHEHHVLHLKR